MEKLWLPIKMDQDTKAFSEEERKTEKEDGSVVALPSKSERN